MTLLHAICLGILQGITEFLPISSSGHLVLGETLFQLDVESLKDFDVVVHVGTLLAIVIYFWRDLLQTKYWKWLIWGTIPAVIVGFTLEEQIDALFRSASVVGVVMMLLGLVFLLPEKWKLRSTSQAFTWWKVLLIGLAQAIAIIPGVSRSGSTIFTGTMLGLQREEAARFSFMLGSIAIAGAGLLTAKDLVGPFAEADASWQTSPLTLLVGFLAAFLSGLGAVHWLMAYLKKHSLKVFGIYLLVVGGVSLLLF